MNNCYGNTYSDIIRKHGSSKMFLAAIVCGLIAIPLSSLGFILFFSNFFDFLQADRFFNAVFGEMGFVFPIFVFVGIYLIAVIVTGIIMQCFLLRGYNFFSGKTSNPNGFKNYLSTMKVQLGFTFGFLGVYIIYMLGFMYSRIGLTGESILIGLLFVLPIFGATVAGSIVLSVILFKGIRKCMEHAMHAVENRYESKMSIFVVVMAIYSAASMASSCIYFFAFMFLSIFIPEIGMIISTESALIMFAAMALQLISYIFYIVLFFKFRSEMNKLKKAIDGPKQQCCGNNSPGYNNFT